MHLTLGNHEERILRAVERDAKLEGTITLKDLNYEKFGWTVHEFLRPIILDDIAFCHYFPSGTLGRPTSSARAILNKMHMSCIAGHLQGRDIAYAKRADGRQITAIIAGSCLTPDHKVLTADLRYVPLGEIKVDDKLLSFEEEVGLNSRSRRYKKGTVQATKLELDDVYKVTLESGKQFKVTEDHRWFVRTGSKYHWVSTDKLRKGTRIPKLMDEWNELDSKDSGWLAGMYDGEGCLHQRKTTGGKCIQLGISQKQGPVLNKVSQTLFNLFGLASVT